MTNIQLPDDSIKYVLFQRTGYLKNNLLFNGLSLLGLIKPLYAMSVDLKTNWFTPAIKTAFNQDMAMEYTTLKEHLPANAHAVLDIGCGVAGIDVLISDHYQHTVDIFLLDKTKVDGSVYYKFEERGSFYNSLEISKKILTLNGVTPEKIHVQEATEKNEITFSEHFDVVISLISWGFHYPITTYLDTVYAHLNPGGVLIVDVRKNTGGKEAIEKLFGNITVIVDTDKYYRVLAKKQ